MKTNEEIINGTGLFFWGSTLPAKKKIEIINWYKALPKTEQEFVNIIRNEGANEAEYDANEHE